MNFLFSKYHRCPCYGNGKKCAVLGQGVLPIDGSHPPLTPPPFLVLDADEILVWHEACLPFAVFILLRLELLRYGSYSEL